MREAAYLRDRRPPCLLYGLGLQQRLELPVERVSFAHQHAPPPQGRLDAGGAEHVQELGAALDASCSKSARIASWIALLVLNMSLQISFFSSSVQLSGEYRQRSARKNAISSAWVSSVILASFIVVPFINFRTNTEAPLTGFHGRIHGRKIPKGALFSVEEWCAEKLDTTLLTCGNVVFWGRP